MVRVRVKEQNPLQKPWVSPRFRMARSGQERQRLKAFYLLDKARKEPLLPSAKIRYLLDCCQNDTCLVTARAGIGIGHPRFFLSSITGAIQVPLLLPLFHHLSSIIGAIQVPLLLPLFHHWCHPDLPSRCQSRIEGSIVPVYYYYYYYYFFSQLMIVGLSKPLYILYYLMI